jgi:hypothetical protein
MIYQPILKTKKWCQTIHNCKIHGVREGSLWGVYSIPRTCEYVEKLIMKKAEKFMKRCIM